MGGGGAAVGDELEDVNAELLEEFGCAGVAVPAIFIAPVEDVLGFGVGVFFQPLACCAWRRHWVGGYWVWRARAIFKVAGRRGRGGRGIGVEGLSRQGICNKMRGGGAAVGDELEDVNAELLEELFSARIGILAMGIAPVEDVLSFGVGVFGEPELGGIG